MSEQRKLYLCYHQAKGRCNNPTHRAYKYYGGRGIQFKFKSFQQFVQELGPRPIGYCLDRINNNGHYEPGNVRWCTPSASSFNTRRSIPASQIQETVRYYKHKKGGFMGFVNGKYSHYVKELP